MEERYALCYGFHKGPMRSRSYLVYLNDIFEASLSGSELVGRYNLASGPGCSKDYANPGSEKILISVLSLFGKFVGLYCMSFSFEFE